MVFWRKNALQLQSNKESKKFADNIASLINDWLFDSPTKSITINSMMLLPDFPLQNSSPKPSENINKAHLKRSFKLWKEKNVKVF